MTDARNAGWPAIAVFVRRGYDAFSHGDAGPVLELIDPEFELHEPGGGVEPSVRRGRDGFIASIQNLLDVWDDFHLEVAEIENLGDRILVFLRMTGRGRASGVPVEASVAHSWTIRDGKAVELRIWTDWAAARAESSRSGPQYRLLPPRPTFSEDMSPAEADVMRRHVACWQDPG